MKTVFLFAEPTFGPRLGSPIPVRHTLGQACTEHGTRLVEDLNAYRAMPCPTAADCFDVIDESTGTVLIKGIKGQADFRAGCGRWGYSVPEEIGSEECPPGQGMIAGQCGKFAIACLRGDGYEILEATMDAEGSVTGLTGRVFAKGISPDKVNIMPRVGMRPTTDPWCQIPVPTPQPAQTTTPLPIPTDQTGTIPLSITPAKQGIPIQNGIQPSAKPLPLAPAPQAKPLETGSAIGIGVVMLTAIGAALFGQ